MLIPLRDERRLRRTPYVTIGIIAFNVAIFLYQISMSPAQLNSFFGRYALFPGAITAELFGGAQIAPSDMLRPAFLTVFTSMFLHGGLLHIAGNMLYFWVFGNNIEDTFGSIKFIAFYLLSGIGAAAAHIASAPNAMIPTIGASGAIAGVLASYLVMYPRVRIVTVVPVFFFITFIRVPALIFIGLWFVLQALQGTASLGASSGAGVAWFAHIGGFAVGLILTLVFMPKGRRRTVES